MRMDPCDSVPDAKSIRVGHFDDISLREVDIDLLDSYLEKRCSLSGFQKISDDRTDL